MSSETCYPVCMLLPRHFVMFGLYQFCGTMSQTWPSFKMFTPCIGPCYDTCGNPIPLAQYSVILNTGLESSWSPTVTPGLVIFISCRAPWHLNKYPWFCFAKPLPSSDLELSEESVAILKSCRLLILSRTLCRQNAVFPHTEGSRGLCSRGHSQNPYLWGHPWISPVHQQPGRIATGKFSLP